MSDEDTTEPNRAEAFADASHEWIDALKARRREPVVTIRRRRRADVQAEADAPPGDAARGLGGDERPARTFRLAAPTPDGETADRSRRRGSSTVETLPSVATPSGAARSRRRRVDPSRRPGTVHRVVIAAPAARSPAIDPGAAADPAGRTADPVSPSDFRAVLRAMEILRSTLEDVRRLAHFDVHA